jgi:[protein-PII] uridylyltransferase
MTDLRSLPGNVYSAVDWQHLEGQTATQGVDVSSYRALLKQSDEALAQAFYDGVDIAALVTGRAIIVDHVLKMAWRSFNMQTVSDLALVAVGGYGRGELHPHSDVDLLFLLGESSDQDIDHKLSQVLSFLWDIGLPVGHSTRTLQDCVLEAQKDITVVTNMMESRLLTGPQRLHEALMQQTGPSRIWLSADFFSAKLSEQKKRYHKFGNTAYRLEPNIKEGPGGLRDIQMIGWIAKRHWNRSNLDEIVNHRFLTENEYHALRAGEHHLWRVRFALHLLAGRAEDRLLFDYQRQLATLFGYSNQDNNLAVEQFMQQYYRTITELERLNEMLLQLFKEVILYTFEPAQQNIISPRFRHRFQARKGFLEVIDEQIFVRYPSAWLEVFLVLELNPQLKGIRASTIRLIRNHRHLIDEKFRSNPVNRGLFMEMLRQPEGITHAFRRMNRYGVLAAYWPSFAKIVGRMQYDLFHTYTVEEHTLFVLRNIRRFTVVQHAHELPFCSKLIKEIPKLDILYLAALFHDIAKGRGGDHSELGAKEAERFCLQHGLSYFDARMVAWLVKYHLLMSLTAQRMDISDPSVIHDFAHRVGSLHRLNYLYLLTVADIRGTNPSLWNAWKDALLVDLYRSTRRVLRRGLGAPIVSEEIVEDAKTTALQILEVCQIPRADSKRLWQQFNDDYFLRHSADEIAWHTQAIIESGPITGPLVLVRQLTARGSTEIFVYTQDHEHLFAHIANVLAQQGLDILDARIITTQAGYTLDTFLVLDESGDPITDEYRIQEISQVMTRLLRNPQQPPLEVARRVARHIKYFDVETRITFENESNSRNTLLELITADHPGLLSRVGRAFIESDVLVENARITTLGAQAEDLFNITDIEHRPIADTVRQARIRQSILRHLEELPGFAKH